MKTLTKWGSVSLLANTSMCQEGAPQNHREDSPYTWEPPSAHPVDPSSRRRSAPRVTN